jgi:hypothetical protein
VLALVVRGSLWKKGPDRSIESISLLRRKLRERLLDVPGHAGPVGPVEFNGFAAQARQATELAR